MYLLVFNTLKPTVKLEYWLSTIQVRAPNSVVLLIGTHIDDKRLANSNFSVIESNLQEKFCNHFKNIAGIHFVSCSNLTGIR